MPPLDSAQPPMAQPTDAPPPSTIRPNPDYVPRYIVQPAAWRLDIDQANGLSRATYPGEVFVGDNTVANNQVATKGDIAAATTGVSSFNTRTGAVTLTGADVTSAGGALLASPAFTGNPTAPTQAPGDNDQSIATTAFVMAAVGTLQAASVASFNGRTGAVTLTGADVTSAGGALLNSPTFVGTPTAPTQGNNDATGNLATTQFVQNVVSAKSVTSWNGRLGAVTLTLSDITSAGGAPNASPGLTGIPTAPTATVGTATTQLATTAFVANTISAISAGVTTFNGRSGAVTLQAADVSGVGGALLAGPTFTGTPSAPTATAGTSTTQIATTAFVANAISTLPGVSSFNSRQGAVTLQLTDVTSVGGAPLASPNFSGSPTSTTPPPADNSTRVATTAFVAASFAPLASPALTGNPTAPTQAPGDNDTSIATTAFVQAAMAASSAAVNNTNYIDNSAFTVNQRGYTSGSALAAGAFGFDRWKGGAAGCTLTFTASPASTTINIAAGSLQQVVEGAGLLTGTYTLSWTGTAQARIGAGSYAASPIAVSATAGTNLTIEFNTGTVSRVKLEMGTTATTWQPPPPQTELARCQRFFFAFGGILSMASYAGNAGANFFQQFWLPVTMRAAPTIGLTYGSNVNVSATSYQYVTPNKIELYITATASGGFSSNLTALNASADL